MDLNTNNEISPRVSSTKQPLAAQKSKNEAPNSQRVDQNDIKQTPSSQSIGTNSPNKVDLRV